MASTEVSARARRDFMDRARSRPGMWSRFLWFLRHKPLGAIGAALMIILVVVALVAPLIQMYDPLSQDADILLAPSTSHFFGTDRYGRDVFSRIVWGSRISLWVGIVSIGLGTLAGTSVGLISGYLGGKVDFAVQRVVDTMMAFPGLILILGIMAVLGASITNVMIALGIMMTPGFSRIVRGSVLSQKENQYVEAARSIGCGGLRICFIHILPNVTAPIIIMATVGLGGAILSEASLSFLGFGTPPPNPSWGGMLSGESRFFLMKAPWLAVFPGLAISLAVLGFNLFGDALRDVWDPRLRGT